MKSRRIGALRALINRIQHGRAAGAPTMWQMLVGFPQLVGATMSGKYTQGSRPKILAMFVAVVYILLPFDAMPEWILGLFGLVDDAMVMTWLAGAVIDESTAYSRWQQTKDPAESPEVVRSHVVE